MAKNLSKKSEQAKPSIQSPVKKTISIENARVHNLKNVSVQIPRNAITVISGVSGSGKSSLAFDTLYAEGQRRFVESLSSYARQFLERMNKPDVDAIRGLPPAIAIEQRGFSKNARSTVGTTTEIYDFLRLLYGRVGTTICTCGKIVQKDTPQSIQKSVLRSCADSRIYVLFPFVNDGMQSTEQLVKLQGLGYDRVYHYHRKEIIDFADIDTKELVAHPQHFYIVADRVIVKPHDKDAVSRLFESIEISLRFGEGKIYIRDITLGLDFKFSSKFECPDCHISYTEPEPRLFSFNSPFGACRVCEGFGRSMGIDEKLVIPDRVRSIKDYAIAPISPSGFYEWYAGLLEFCKRNGISTTVPYASLSHEEQSKIWNGDKQYSGVNGFFAMLEAGSHKLHYRVLVSRYRGYTTCKKCEGSRLRNSARRVFVGSTSMHQVVSMTLEQSLQHFTSLTLTAFQMKVVEPVLKEIRWRLELLVEIGLGYLTLDRLSHTLSGGESQRINLATSLGSSLVGTLYVLDEPSIGLHSRDTARLVALLKKLRNLGNTVVVVEHDPDIIKSADFIIDIGPKAGENGGTITATGTVNEIEKNPTSLTGKYLSGTKRIALPQKRKKVVNSLVITQPRERNLKGENVVIPLKMMTVVTGVSGSGKSTLIHQVLYNNLRYQKGYTSDGQVGACSGIENLHLIDNVEMIDQTPIGRSSRSTPITYTKAFDHIREIFADTPAAKQMGVRAGYFSFNVPGGRCESCEGEGNVTVEMQFLPDITLECESCKGTRYTREAREFTYRGKNIVEVLGMTVDEALEFFHGNKKVVSRLQVLADVGLGYLRLGQPSSMLSGGEAQRIKLATYIDDSSNNAKHTLFIFDEPTTGLHIDDIQKLLTCFQALIEKGNSVLIIEHNLHIIAAADWIIDLGPDAGEKGGYIIAEGTPEQVAKVKKSYTGIALKEFLSNYA